MRVHLTQYQGGLVDGQDRGFLMVDHDEIYQSTSTPPSKALVWRSKMMAATEAEAGHG